MKGIKESPLVWCQATSRAYVLCFVSSSFVSDRLADLGAPRCQGQKIGTFNQPHRDSQYHLSLPNVLVAAPHLKVGTVGICEAGVVRAASAVKPITSDRTYAIREDLPYQVDKTGVLCTC